MDENLVQEASHSLSVESDSKVETMNDTDASENRETFGDSEFSGHGETFSGLESSSCLAPCPVCGDDPSKASPQLLACPHSVCLTCSRGQEMITCSRCRQDTRVADLVADFVYQKTDNPDRSGGEDEYLVSSLLSAVKARIGQLPGVVSGLSNPLGDLHEVRDNTRSLVEEIYQSYREVLEQCKNAALMDLEERHNQRELAIMEKLEHYDITDSCLEQAMTYTEQLVRNCSGAEQQQLEGKVVDRIKNLLAQLDRKPAGLQTSLELESDKAAFSAAVRKNFDKFSLSVVSSSTGVTVTSPSLVVGDTAHSSQTALVQALLTPAPTLGQVTMTRTPGLLSLSPASPSFSLPISSQQGPPRPRAGHGPIGSSISSPAHQYSLPPRSHIGLSHPDLSLSSPSHSLDLTQHTPTPPLQHNTNVEFNLAQLANISMEKSTSGSINTNPSFSLADLISNVEADSVPPLTPSWDPSDPSFHPPQHQHQALNNLAALAKLDDYNQGSVCSCNNVLPPQDHTLLLPDLNRDHNSILTRSLSNLGSDTSPGNHSMVSPGNHSVSPVLGLTVPHMGGRGTSPISPIDNLMPQLGGLSISPVPGNILTQPILSSGINMSGLMTRPGSAQPRSVRKSQLLYLCFGD